MSSFGIFADKKTGIVQYFQDQYTYEFKIDTAFEERKRILKLLRANGFDDAVKLIKKGK